MGSTCLCTPPVPLSSYLKHERRGSRGEVEALAHMFLWVILRHITLNHHSLGSTLFTYQQYSLNNKHKEYIITSNLKPFALKRFLQSPVIRAQLCTHILTCQ